MTLAWEKGAPRVVFITGPGKKGNMKKVSGTISDGKD